MAISVIVGLDTVGKHRLLDQRITLETNCQVGRFCTRFLQQDKVRRTYARGLINKMATAFGREA
jgi:hypothetical protein